MSNSVRCPKCSSDQITAQKRGFSGGKAVAGAVLTGGVGALAGFHGSDKLDIYCLSCGHKWDLVARALQAKRNAQQAQMKRLNRARKKEKIWKKQFFRAYESGNLDEADTIIRQKLRSLVESRGVDGAYKALKRLETITMVVKLGFVFGFVGLILWMVA
ncbi:hypothetical protein [Spirosoma sp. 209]|uniref:hypothetical protein n=1 Tax=Spirosoma sp. 209 TaxID=1955701 RepID=UPI00098D491D|nr:hypothetical protein [Spirosoma sp. 209]